MYYQQLGSNRGILCNLLYIKHQRHFIQPPVHQTPDVLYPTSCIKQMHFIQPPVHQHQMHFMQPPVSSIRCILSNLLYIKHQGHFIQPPVSNRCILSNLLYIKQKHCIQPPVHQTSVILSNLLYIKYQRHFIQPPEHQTSEAFYPTSGTSNLIIHQTDMLPNLLYVKHYHVSNRGILHSIQPPICQTLSYIK